jgi:alpha-1,2-mannosyltransferase
MPRTGAMDCAPGCTVSTRTRRVTQIPAGSEPFVNNNRLFRRQPDRATRRPDWLLLGGPIVLATSLAMLVVTYLRWPVLLEQVDMQVYRYGAERVVAGVDLYSTGLTGNHTELLFDYTPFAALCFIPLMLFSGVWLKLLWLMVNAAAIGYATWRLAKSCGVVSRTALFSLTALGAGTIAWLEPVRLTLQLGQINVVILAVVVADLLAPTDRRWAGIGVGLVAAIKLTPALFIVYLVAVGRIRAAVVAVVTAAATVVAGFAVLPKDSTDFWLRGGFDDVRRISRDPLANASLRGLLLRLHVEPSTAVLAALVVATVAVALAAWSCRRGQPVLALSIVGMASAAASPFSWGHHWVWFSPLVVYLGHRATVLRSRCSAATLCVLFVLLAGWIIASPGGTPQAGVLSLRPGGVWTQIVSGTYDLVFLAVLAVTAAIFLRRRGQTGGSSSDNGAESNEHGVGSDRFVLTASR